MKCDFPALIKQILRYSNCICRLDHHQYLYINKAMALHIPVGVYCAWQCVNKHECEIMMLVQLKLQQMHSLHDEVFWGGVLCEL